jgi:hypothetical protein
MTRATGTAPHASLRTWPRRRRVPVVGTLVAGAILALAVYGGVALASQPSSSTSTPFEAVPRIPLQEAVVNLVQSVSPSVVQADAPRAQILTNLFGPPHGPLNASDHRGIKRTTTINEERPVMSRQLRLIAIGATAVAIGGGAYGIVSAAAGNGSSTATTTTSATAPAGRPGFGGGGGSNARSGPAAGGTVGTVTSVSTSSFTLATSAGQKVIVTKASSTTYKKGTSSASASVVKKGVNVLVLGTANGTALKAAQVIVQSKSAASSAVVPFQPGAPSTAKQVGQIPANYTEGSGTIVGGTAANKATTAALASYPGGVVDRVVKLSNGEYEVHNIGVNWPHHVFVSTSFKVVGAN